MRRATSMRRRNKPSKTNLGAKRRQTIRWRRCSPVKRRVMQAIEVWWRRNMKIGVMSEGGQNDGGLKVRYSGWVSSRPGNVKSCQVR